MVELVTVKNHLPVAEFIWWFLTLPDFFAISLFFLTLLNCSALFLFFLLLQPGLANICALHFISP